MNHTTINWPGLRFTENSQGEGQGAGLPRNVFKMVKHLKARLLDEVINR